MTRQMALGGSVVVAILLLLSACAGGQAATPTPEPLLFPTFTPTIAPTPVPVVPTMVVELDRLKVANTGGEGAMLRKTPGGDPIRAWNDGTVMQVVGRTQQASGHTWQNVKDPAGNTGWMATDFLTAAPAAAGTPTAAGTACPAATPTPKR